MAMEYFLCYHSYLKKCEKLSDQELGRLFRSLLTYSATGEAEELAGRESIAFDFIADDIDRAKENYANKCFRLSQNGSSGGRPKNQMVLEKANGFQKSKCKENKDEDKEEDEDNLPPKSPAGECEERFAEFWKVYPKKVGKGAALSAWKKRSPGKELTKRMISAVEKQKQSAQWTKDNGQFIPNPATWLNQQRWEDELEGGKQAQAGALKSYDIGELERLSYFDLPENL